MVLIHNTESSNDIWSFYKDFFNKYQNIHNEHCDIPTDLKYYINQ